MLQNNVNSLFTLSTHSYDTIMFSLILWTSFSWVLLEYYTKLMWYVLLSSLNAKACCRIACTYFFMLCIVHHYYIYVFNTHIMYKIIEIFYFPMLQYHTIYPYIIILWFVNKLQWYYNNFTYTTKTNMDQQINLKWLCVFTYTF